MSEKNTVDFWFDPICPWCWITSRWIVDVEKIRDIEVNWHPFSLSTLNKGRDLPEDYRAAMDRSWAPARVAAAVAQKFPGTVGEFYTALGTEIHHNENKTNDYKDALVAALETVELPAELVDAGFSDEYDQALVDSNAAALDLVGDDVGVPIIALNGSSFFGPVISPAPQGEEAGKIFDAAVALASYPGFFELKRSRTVEPIFNKN
ncbi:DsbA family protein [Rothia sp. ZJ932]|uniref:mycothiol-dependent nitroreductase Rv2466c family protein n=1 Tax=Rothia sp. ZJ932 TaxID=2810516 RepID=UPI001967CC94|nr:DsbA family protein [Rothia sp. ZJ932]QRZ60842.1 DsbA family protein [Rothia sp. ZJ932]